MENGEVHTEFDCVTSRTEAAPEGH